MTATLTPTQVSTKHFTWLNDHATAEASDLPKRGFGLFGRIYEDACDEGLTLVSHRTGEQVVCVVTDVKYDSEGDLRYWTLAPVDPRHQFTVTIFND